jgi:hypothetical protein
MKMFFMLCDVFVLHLAVKVAQQQIAADAAAQVAADGATAALGLMQSLASAADAPADAAADAPVLLQVKTETNELVLCGVVVDVEGSDWGQVDSDSDIHHSPVNDVDDVNTDITGDLTGSDSDTLHYEAGAANAGHGGDKTDEGHDCSSIVGNDNLAPPPGWIPGTGSDAPLAAPAAPQAAPEAPLAAPAAPQAPEQEEEEEEEEEEGEEKFEARLEATEQQILQASQSLGHAHAALAAAAGAASSSTSSSETASSSTASSSTSTSSTYSAPASTLKSLFGQQIFEPAKRPKRRVSSKKKNEEVQMKPDEKKKDPSNKKKKGDDKKKKGPDNKKK